MVGRFTLFLTCVAMACLSPALATTATLTVGDATRSLGGGPVPMTFPITRGGNPGIDVALHYHTLDGSALGGVDYITTSGTLWLAAGQTGAVVPVTLAAQASNGPDLAFQLYVDGATGIGPAPTFTGVQSIASGANARGVILEDLDGDGLRDLVAAGGNDHIVSVQRNITMPGASSPDFRAHLVHAVGWNATAVAAADLNGDGRPDLVVVNRDANTVSALLNTTTVSPPGSPSLNFDTQRSFATGSTPTSVAIADMNIDGKPDLIVANGDGHSISVLLNTTLAGTGLPAFVTQQVFAAGLSPAAVTAADINGDGRPDAIVADAASNTVSVLLGSAAPGSSTASFANPVFLATGAGPLDVVAVDVDADGRPDLVSADSGDDTVSVLLNDTAPGASKPAFAARRAFATGAGPVAVRAADVNGDGKPDLAVVDGSGSSPSILRNATVPGAGEPHFLARQDYAVGTDPVAVAMGDVNGDGKPDIAVSSDAPGSVLILPNDTASVSAEAFEIQPDVATGTTPASIASADFNADGKPDLVVANRTGGSVSVLRNVTPAGAAVSTFATQQMFGAGNTPFAVRAADVNSDGRPDVLVANYGSSSVSVLLNTTPPGATAFSFATQATFATDTAPSSVIAADINGDGKPDLCVTNAMSNTLSVLFNTTPAGAATPTFAARQSVGVAQGPRSLVSADIDGDGRPDLALVGNTVSAVDVFLNTTTPGAMTLSLVGRYTASAGSSPMSVIPADLNGDGRPDLIVAGAGTTMLSLLRNTTSIGGNPASFAPPQSFNMMVTTLTSVVTAELDGDGRIDLGIANPDNDMVFIVLNTTPIGADTFSLLPIQSVFTAIGPRALTTADLNGDGRIDLAVADAGDNTAAGILNTQFQRVVTGSPATGTIVRDYLFGTGFE